MPYDVELAGCSPVPIASYLKALAVLRLVAEQADPDARGFWIDAGFVLRSDLDTSRLRRFFLDQYRPSAIVAPWNGGSGFYPNDNTSALDAIVAGAANRFTLVRETILAARELVSRFGLKESPKDQTQKAVFLENVRSLVVDEALTWMDAAVVLSAENPSYPPSSGQVVTTAGWTSQTTFCNAWLSFLIPTRAHLAPKRRAGLKAHFPARRSQDCNPARSANSNRARRAARTHRRALRVIPSSIPGTSCSRLRGH